MTLLLLAILLLSFCSRVYFTFTVYVRNLEQYVRHNNGTICHKPNRLVQQLSPINFDKFPSPIDLNKFLSPIDFNNFLSPIDFNNALD